MDFVTSPRTTPKDVVRLLVNLLEQVGDQTEYYENGAVVIATLKAFRGGDLTIHKKRLSGNPLSG